MSENTTRRTLLSGIAAAPLAAALPAPAGGAVSPADRRAMEAYASWLFYERRLLCAELYPDEKRPDAFVMAGNAGFDWHFRAESPQTWRDLPQPSTRAGAVLQLVGVDWAGHPERDWPEYRDSGVRPSLPTAWPHVDADLIGAYDELVSLDLQIENLHETLGEGADETPQYVALEEQRWEVLDIFSSTPARSLDGMRAKAQALKTPGVRGDMDTTRDITASLIDDVLALPSHRENIVRQS